MTAQPPLPTFTLLTKEQIWGGYQSDGQLQVMEAYGTKTGMSDLAIVLGGYMGYKGEDRTIDGQKAGFVCSASCDNSGGVISVRSDSADGLCKPNVRFLGVRPVLPSSVASSLGLTDAEPSRKISWHDMVVADIVEYGEYPQEIAHKDVSERLEEAYSAQKLQTTGKQYTFDDEANDAYDAPFRPKEYDEYQLADEKGRTHKYIRVQATPDVNKPALLHGHIPKEGEVCWMEVQPIEWLRDPSGLCVARQALFAGVPFDSQKKYNGNFADTTLQWFLNTHFAKDIQPSHVVAQEQSTEQVAKRSAAGTNWVAHTTAKEIGWTFNIT